MLLVTDKKVPPSELEGQIVGAACHHHVSSGTQVATESRENMPENRRAIIGFHSVA